MKSLLCCLLCAAFLATSALDLSGQSETIVQTLTFNDITKRRGEFIFPEEGKSWRKVLMYYTLKCDARTTADRFACGEWDALSPIFIWDHSGERDSTYRSHPSFRVGGQAPERLDVTESPVWDEYQSWQYHRVITEELNLRTAAIGEGAEHLASPFSSAELTGRAQFLWRASELEAAGLEAGNISGLRLNIAEVGSEIRYLRIALKHSTREEMASATFESGLTRVYDHHTSFDGGGWHDIQFVRDFTWNGTDNIIVEFSFANNEQGKNNEVLATSTEWASGVSVSADEYAMEFSGGRQLVDLGPGPQVAGDSPRTIEAWALTRSFNDAGIFEAGGHWATGSDFSLRTSRTDNQWRVQLWGEPDYDVTLPGSLGSWHHYALVFDGAGTAIYYDGQLIRRSLTTLETPEASVIVGRWLNSYFDGLVDEVRIWDKALDAALIDEWKDKSPDASHPDYANLIGYYDFNASEGFHTPDRSPAAQGPGFIDGAGLRRVDPADLRLNIQSLGMRPNIVFEQGEYVSHLDSTLITERITRRPMTVLFYDNPADGRQVPDDAVNHPTIPTDTTLYWEAETWRYLYDSEGNKADSTWVVADAGFDQELREWYSPVVRYEIGRYITPYGINLDLGPEGFTWIYDVTDYAHLLHGLVDLQAGDQRELIDLKFVMTEGTPPAKVAAITKVWGEQRSFRYERLDKDLEMSDTAINVAEGAREFKLKMRLTGHGHHSNSGQYPHCCEWKDNTHYLFVNGEEAAEWHIWQTRDCAMNPLFPQGGTWPGAREGWCPGDVVKDSEFNITRFVSGETINFDYAITPVPLTNQDMGRGDYIIATHLMQYEQPSFSLDAEVYDVVTPNDWEYYGRYNPLCGSPRIVIRNNGSETLTSLKIRYRVEGGRSEEFRWTGSLRFLEREEVTLPIENSLFFDGNGSNTFIATVSEPNGQADQYADNDRATTTFELPDIYDGRIVIQLRTNARASDNSYEVRNAGGDVVHSRANLRINTQYSDTLDLPNGCYTLDLVDSNNDGLSYWAFQAQGNGSLRILRPDGSTLRSFESEFGHRIIHAFSIGPIVNVAESEAPAGFDIYPNPATSKTLLQLRDLHGTFQIHIDNLLGQSVYRNRIVVNGRNSMSIGLDALPPGTYLVRCFNEKQSFTRKLFVE